MTMEWLTIIAIAFGPFFGIWAHGKLENRKRTYERKLDIFKILMSTRATPLADVHVQSLNRIDIEFTEHKERKVREAWAVLLDHYTQGPIPPTKLLPSQLQVDRDKYDQELQAYRSAQALWNDRVIALRATLLKEMGAIFKYDFDEVRIKKAIYHPQLHESLETERLFLLKTANDVLSGQRPIGISVWPEHGREEHPKAT